MATFSNIKAFSGLYGNASSSNPQESNEVQVGISPTTTALSSATKIISFEALVVGTSSDLVIDISDLDSTGSTAWTAGTAQVETATAAGTITGSGNASVTVTADGMPGSPKTISVAVLNGDTAADWAAKVRTALAADTSVSVVFDVSGTSAAIVLTRKPYNTYTIRGSSVPVYRANDATLNIALDNGTCTGITPAATSADTTPGVATAGVYAPDLDGNDAFGDATSGATLVYGLLIKCDWPSEDYIKITEGSVMTEYPLQVGAELMMADAFGRLPDDITIEPSANDAKVTITIAAS